MGVVFTRVALVFRQPITKALKKMTAFENALLCMTNRGRRVCITDVGFRQVPIY